MNHIRISGRDALNSSPFVILAAAFPDHKDVSVWKGQIEAYADNYLAILSRIRTVLALCLLDCSQGKDPGGNRKAGNYWYRYFMQPDPEWWVGINSNLASAGVGLDQGSKYTEG